MENNQLWERINHLIPNPKCKTKGNKIIEWKDSRKQPTTKQLQDIDINSILTVSKLKNKIKVEAKKRIDETIPESFGESDKVVAQQNVLMQIMWLINRKVSETITTKEKKELESLLGIKENIDKIRQASKDIIIDLESEIDPSTFNYIDHPVWP